jgi:cyclase
MYKLFKLILLFVVLAFAFAPEMKLKRVSGNIYMVRGVDALPSLENRGFMSNAFAVLTKEGWVVVANSEAVLKIPCWDRPPSLQGN